MRLAHLHIPNIIPFTHASLIQQTLVTRLLAHKKETSASTSSSTSSSPIPDPTLFTFTPNPVYTTGRRDLPPQDTTSSTAPPNDPLQLPTPLQPIRHLFTSSPPIAEFHPTLRGGQTTYHGPGQLVAYTILDLRQLRIGPRAHIRLLEESVLDVLAHYRIQGLLSDDPGVWIDPSNPRIGDRQQKDVAREGAGGGGGHTGSGGGSADDVVLPRKITAVGVHLRRFVSSFGIGLNVTEEPMWFFRQIVACGLEGRGTTSLEGMGVKGVSVEEVAGRFVQAFVERVNSGGPSDGSGPRIDEVYKIDERDVFVDR